MRAKQISCPIDFDLNGRQVGYLRLPHSTHDSAYGFLPIPIACLRNGEGPTLLVLAGNHGDEYEGPIAAYDLIRSIDVDQLKGRVIVLASANHPALVAGRRVSPIDNGNLNRCFPGDPDGTPTQQIADFVENKLLAISTHAIDLHSGGSSLLYVPSGVGNLLPGETDRNRQMLDMLDAFGAPVSFVSETTRGASQSFASAAVRKNVISIGTEAGGGGMTGRFALDVVASGLKRLMSHLGLIETADAPKASPTRLLDVGGPDYFAYAPTRGVFEPLVEPGDMVEQGQLAARIHNPDRPWDEPELVHFERAGFVLCRRALGIASPGDCLYHLGTDRPA